MCVRTCRDASHRDDFLVAWGRSVDLVAYPAGAIKEERERMKRDGRKRNGALE